MRGRRRHRAPRSEARRTGRRRTAPRTRQRRAPLPPTPARMPRPAAGADPSARPGSTTSSRLALWTTATAHSPLPDAAPPDVGGESDRCSNDVHISSFATIRGEFGAMAVPCRSKSGVPPRDGVVRPVRHAARAHASCEFERVVLRLCQPGLIQRLAAVAEQTLTGSLRRLQLRVTYFESLQRRVSTCRTLLCCRGRARSAPRWCAGSWRTRAPGSASIRCGTPRSPSWSALWSSRVAPRDFQSSPRMRMRVATAPPVRRVQERRALRAAGGVCAGSRPCG